MEPLPSAGDAPQSAAATALEPPPRIKLRSLLLNSGLTLALAGSVLWWAVRGVSSTQLREGLTGVRPWVVAATMAVFTLTFFTVEIIGLGTSWRRSLDRTTAWRDIRTLVCGKQVLFFIQPLLTKIVAPIYFWKRARIRPTVSVSATEFVGIAEVFSVLVLVTLGLVVSDVGVGTGLTVTVAVSWIVIGLLAGMASARLQRRFPRLRTVGLLQAFTSATPRQAAFQVALRTGLLLVTLGCLWVLLAEMGARLSLAQLLAFGPLFIYAATLPVSVGGFGGPQGLAVMLLAGQWAVLAPNRALGFSLVWSTGILLCESAVGLAHLPRLLELLGVRRSG